MLRLDGVIVASSLPFRQTAAGKPEKIFVSCRETVFAHLTGGSAPQAAALRAVSAPVVGFVSANADAYVFASAFAFVCVFDFVIVYVIVIGIRPYTLVCGRIRKHAFALLRGLWYAEVKE